MAVAQAPRTIACLVTTLLLAQTYAAKIPLSERIKALKAPRWHSERVFVPEHERRFGEVENETLSLHPYSGGGTTAYIHHVPPFWINKYEVSIARFAEFAAHAGAPTEAEAVGTSSMTLHRALFGVAKEDSLETFLRQNMGQVYRTNVTATKAHVLRPGAAWFAPSGKLNSAKRALCQTARNKCCNSGHKCNMTEFSCSTIDSLCPRADVEPIAGFESHPVTHVTQKEAQLFCDWDGGTLPTEEQWEAAAGGTLQGARFPWGSSLLTNGTHRANLWQGMWPRLNTLRDGQRFTAPIDAFGPQNEWGIFNLIGNVAEHTATPFCNATSQALRSTANSESCDSIFQQVGMMSDMIKKDDKNNMFAGLPPDMAYADTTIVKGGSYMSHVSSDGLIRIGGRGLAFANTTRDTLGFRCAYTSPNLRYAEGHVPVVVPNKPPPAPPVPTRFKPSNNTRVLKNLEEVKLDD